MGTPVSGQTRPSKREVVLLTLVWGIDFAYNGVKSKVMENLTNTPLLGAFSTGKTCQGWANASP